MPVGTTQHDGSKFPKSSTILARYSGKDHLKIPRGNYKSLFEDFVSVNLANDKAGINLRLAGHIGFHPRRVLLVIVTSGIAQML